ncbi:thiamine biosynthesis protein ThiS [Tumebacillus algifaecis]|uniref:Thiamine biosynthesis protein ThiS n=1 Tax=Tumebacillus algifaecis TaxID=1214604 RepID=A0A223D0K1_9BACL|nr:sulfur carrier protein ThiS [Tumebacillus algifaecis]ASS75081.1 thiamine biosynthesis protein ThiS [Tumebacillus algifaecis]
MTLLINGQQREVEAVQTLADVVNHFGLNERIIIIEHNLNIVPRDQYAGTQVHDGDKIEIVHFVGGGY